MEIDPHQFNLRRCVEEVLDLFSGKASQAGIDLIYQIDHRIPTQLVSDSLRIRQVLLNLVGNALKFTKEGEVYIGVSLLNELPSGQLELGFEVRDTGIGIPPDKLSKLFKAFSQVDSSTTRKYGGTGLGLVICERLIELLGGHIDVTSELGQGATFSFNIICGVGETTAPQYATINLNGCEGKKILVVDDNQTNMKIIEKQLIQWKLSPVLARSGKEALDILSADNDFHLLISDMQMPEMDGVEFSTRVKKIHPDLPIILLSSNGDESRKKYDNLFDAILTKPVKQDAFLQVVHNALKQEKAEKSIDIPVKKTLPEDFASRYPFKILVAEDILINQKLILRVLNKLGYTPDLANNGKEVLEKLDAQFYNLIFMDIQMPEMDGLEATRLIRQNYDRQPLIVAMTANAMVEDRDACINAGMDDYISKPIDLTELVALMERTEVKTL